MVICTGSTGASIPADVIIKLERSCDSARGVTRAVDQSEEKNEEILKKIRETIRIKEIFLSCPPEVESLPTPRD